MANPKEWIVYRKPDGHHGAVINTHCEKTDQCQELFDEGNVILGFVYFDTENEAINYIKDCLWRLPKK